jgi:cytochrome b involved in lipid metabolism
MKNLLFLGIGIVALGAVGFFMYERNEEKGLEEYANSIPEVKTETVATTTSATSTSTTTTQTTTQTTTVKKYTMAEISTHNSKEDCWLTINGNVIDVTAFVDKHPGGNKILQGCGKDATGYFNKVPGHMKGIAQTLLNKMKIGELAQ